MLLYQYDHILSSKETHFAAHFIVIVTRLVRHMHLNILTQPRLMKKTLHVYEKLQLFHERNG